MRTDISFSKKKIIWRLFTSLCQKYKSVQPLVFYKTNSSIETIKKRLEHFQTDKALHASSLKWF